jgi:hypothetical protein
MESLEAKLQKLKNAWAEFTMGIANNEAIKDGVDLLTKLLETINRITDAGDGKVGKFTTSILRLGTVLLGLKGGGAVLGGLLKFISPTGLFGKEKGVKGNIFDSLKKSATGLNPALQKTKAKLLNVMAMARDPVWRQ